MTNKHHTTEELFEKGKGISLSQAERDEMKSTLLTYANYHGVKEPPPKKVSRFHSVWLRGLVGSSLVLVMFLGTGYASTNSLPGDVLYNVKTEVVEEMIAFIKITPEARLAYHQERFENRLDELKILGVELSKLEPSIIAGVQDEIEELAFETNEFVLAEVNTPESVDHFSDLLAVSMATEVFLRSHVTDEDFTDLQNATDYIERIHDERVVNFINNGTTTAKKYAEAQLRDITDSVAERQFASSTIQMIQEHLEDAESYSVNDDYENIIKELSEAEQIIKTDEYLKTETVVTGDMTE